MNVPLITWCVIVAVILALVAYRLVRASDYCCKARHRVIEQGSESEELFIPGDRTDPEAGYDE